MSAGKRFVLDADVFIEAHQRHYAFDICPGFWNALIRQHKSSTVCSIDKIKDELVARKKAHNEPDAMEDALSEWATQTVPESFFRGTADKKITAAFSEMINWVHGEDQFSPAAKAEFASVADGWLIAFAKVNSRVVVTHEEYAPDVKKKVPIPNICIEFDVDYCDTFAMLRDLKERFVLQARRRRS